MITNKTRTLPQRVQDKRNKDKHVDTVVDSVRTGKTLWYQDRMGKVAYLDVKRTKESWDRIVKMNSYSPFSILPSNDKLPVYMSETLYDIRKICDLITDEDPTDWHLGSFCASKDIVKSFTGRARRVNINDPKVKSVVDYWGGGIMEITNHALKQMKLRGITQHDIGVLHFHGSLVERSPDNRYLVEHHQASDCNPATNIMFKKQNMSDKEVQVRWKQHLEKCHRQGKNVRMVATGDPSKGERVVVITAYRYGEDDPQGGRNVA